MGASVLIEDLFVWGFQRSLEPGLDYTIGRSRDNLLRFNDPLVSARHAIIRCEESDWIIEDLHSRNGTYINEMAVQRERLRHGDRIRVGQTEMVFQSRSAEVESVLWDRTAAYLTRHERALRDALHHAGGGSSLVLPSTAADDGMEEETAETALDMRPPAAALPELEPGDALWVAEQLVDALGEVIRHARLERIALYRVVLEKARAAIGAENGFLMIPDQMTRRWVIEAGVGNESDWTPYESRHPVPLTIANNAFLQGRVISNALGPAPGLVVTESFMQLGVLYFIAVPLQHHGAHGGLLYFDTRRVSRAFAPRDVVFLQRLGAYLLEIGRLASVP